MLKVKTYLGPSKLHGIGLFTGENIKKGEWVWVYNPKIDLTFDQKQWQEVLASLSEASRDEVVKYAYKSEGRYYLCVDNAQFMNHSAGDFNVGNDSTTDDMFALRDIKKDEELICNYGEYSDSDDLNWSKLRGR